MFNIKTIFTVSVVFLLSNRYYIALASDGERKISSRDCSNNKLKDLKDVKKILDNSLWFYDEKDEAELLTIIERNNLAGLFLELFKEVAICPNGSDKGKFEIITFLNEQSLKRESPSLDFNKPADVIFAVCHPYVCCKDTNGNKYALVIGKFYENTYYIGFFHKYTSKNGVSSIIYRSAAIGEDKDGEVKLFFHPYGKPEDNKPRDDESYFGEDMQTILQKYFEKESKK